MWKVAEDEVTWSRDGIILQGLTLPLNFIPRSCQLPLHTSSWLWGFPDPSVTQLPHPEGKNLRVYDTPFFLAAAGDQCWQDWGHGSLQKYDISSRVWAAVEGCLRVHRLKMVGECQGELSTPFGILAQIAAWQRAGLLLLPSTDGCWPSLRTGRFF